ncbi:universal stress protein [Halorhabdus sp. CBA1104]|uniref:universal stress protein n=1 Tax=unclassified Halorhabdus TaxID=2621901 RepID=UPI0012B2C856|nr:MULTISPECIES: universal stress protein [unclassified Halorhabdus]QGN06886.1 universal stress protein [Halorhabdus sp. CBA1104]
MSTVLAPVRYPLSDHSRATLSRAIEVAHEEDADLAVLHVNLHQTNGHIARPELKSAVEETFGKLPKTRYVVRSGLLVEETILEEVAAMDADVVVIGRKQVSRWREMVRRLADDPDIATYLDGELDCRVVTASVD